MSSAQLEYICPSCASLDEAWCWHTEQQWRLAVEFAKHIGYEPTADNVGAFLEDAESVLPYIGDGPWAFADLEVRTIRLCDSPKSNAWLVTSSTGRHVIATDAEQERMANQCVVPAEYICTLPGTGE